MRLLPLLLLLATVAFGQTVTMSSASDWRTLPMKEIAEKAIIGETWAPVKDIVIKPTEWKIDAAATYDIKPGDRVIIQAGTRGDIKFYNLKGTAENPIIITAIAPVTIKGNTQGAKVVQFFNCDYFIFTGTEKRFIEITGGGHGIDVTDVSNHPEISWLYIHDVGYSGIDIKTYPTCEAKTWRGNYTLYDPKVHHNIIENLKDGEGIYLGPSHYDKSFQPKGCTPPVDAKEHDVVNAQVYNNVLRNIGADGIQVGGATGGFFIRDNQVFNAGTAKTPNQASGIQANPGSTGIIENNVVDGCTNFGIIHQGRQKGSIIRGNLVMNAVGGIMTVAREGDVVPFLIENNTFLNITPAASGAFMQCYSSTAFHNNVVHTKTAVVSTLLYKLYNNTKLTDTGNKVFSGDLAALKLDKDYVPTATSPIPAGVGYKDYVKPEPPAPIVIRQKADVEVVDSAGVRKIYIVTPTRKFILR